MINVLAYQNLSNSSTQMLQTVYNLCCTEKNKHKAFLSTQLNLNEFLEITNHEEEHLVSDFTEKTNTGNYLNASISLPLNSMLFLDLQDKSFYRPDENQSLDIQQIQQMIIPLKDKYDVKDIYIDNFNKVQCFLMGRSDLWQTNPTNIKQFEDWKERQMEYKMALLFYMSRKFDLNFHIGMQWLSTEKKPSQIRFMDFGNIQNMVDEITYQIIEERKPKKL